MSDETCKAGTPSDPSAIVPIATLEMLKKNAARGSVGFSTVPSSAE